MPERPTGHTKLTAKQQRLLAAYAKPDTTLTAAAIEAGYSVKNGRKVASKMLQQPRMQAALAQALRKAGLPLARSLRKVATLHEATKGVYFEGQKVGEEPENAVQLEAAKTSLKLHGHLQATPPPADTPPPTLVLDLALTQQTVVTPPPTLTL